MKKNSSEDKFIEIFNSLEKENKYAPSKQSDKNNGKKISPSDIDINTIDIVLFLFGNILNLLIARYFYKKSLKKNEDEKVKELKEFEKLSKSLEFRIALKERKLKLLQSSFSSVKQLISSKSAKLSEEDIKNKVKESILNEYGEINDKTDLLVNRIVESYKEYLELN